MEENNAPLALQNKYIEDKKENFKSNLENVNQHITKALEDKAHEYNHQIETFFNGVDKEVESNLNKLEIKRKTSNKMFEGFQKMKYAIEEINDDYKICLYKKEKDETIKENRQFLFDIKIFYKSNSLKQKKGLKKKKIILEKNVNLLKKIWIIMNQV